MKDHERMLAVFNGEDPDALEKEVRRLLLSGVYKYPDPAWIREYEAEHRRRIAFPGVFAWALGEVAERYKITDLKVLWKQHLDEACALAGVYRILGRTNQQAEA